MSSVRHELKHHHDLYRPNGDIVIAAKDAGVYHLFRVHTVILSEHSPVFAGLFSLPTPATDHKKVYDGAPLVHIPDNAKAVASLLETFYKPGYPIIKTTDRAFAADVYGLMSIARKYEVDSVCEAIAHRLKEEWPTTFRDFAQSMRDAHQPVDSPSNSSPARSFPEPASAMRLAADFNIPEILPTAYYVLSTYDKRASAEVLRDLLRSEDLVRYYQGKQQLAHQFAHVAMLYKHDLGCPQRTAKSYGDFPYVTQPSSRCWDILSTFEQDWVNSSHKTFVQMLQRGDLVNTYIDEFIKRSNRLCPSCEVKFKAKCKQAIKDIWNDLPTTFSLTECHSVHIPAPADSEEVWPPFLRI